MSRGALGRADLIRWAATLDEERLRRLAEGMGYRELPETDTTGGVNISVPSAVVHVQALSPQVGAEVRRHRHYHLVERHPLAPPPPPPEPPSDSEPEPPAPPSAPPPPLIPWSRLWPFLRAALGELAERHRLDLPRLVAACSRQQPLRRLLRIKGLHWAPRGQLILDLHPRLYPFWADHHVLKERLPCLRGAAGLEILRMDQGPDGPVQPWDGTAWGAPRPYAPPDAATPVLILGDLGCLGAPAQRQAWVRLGRRFAGGGRLPVALTPCPARWWDPALAGLYFPVALDRAAHLPPRPAGPRPWPAQAPDLAQALRQDPGAQRLLTLLRACIAIRPALLRHLRHRLPAHLADAGSEAAAWQHPAFVAGDLALLPADPAAIAALRAEFGATDEADLHQRAWALIRAQQAAEGASRAERLEERILQATLQGRADPEAERFLDQVAKALEQARDANDHEHARALTAWVNRRAGRTHPHAWTCSPRSEALWLLANPQAEHQGAALPPGFDIHRALATQGRPEQVQAWRLVQRGDGLEVEAETAPESPFLSGSPLVGRLLTQQPIVQVREDRPGAPDLSVPLTAGAGLPLGATGWRLRTASEELVIAPLERPAWAHTLGRDQDGLFVGFDDGWGDRRAYWCGPGRGHPEWLGATPFFLDLTALRIEHGFFLDAAQFRTLRSEGLDPSTFDTIGIDEHGIRGELRIKGISLKFRWIWPGRFLMGSPPNEKDRYDDETQHEVILTQGFWLAETACTQALWETIMSENPSFYKDPQRPVESVSWDEIQGFLARLNAELAQRGDPSGLRFRLPTEAEWEYACRAGTTTAYSFGDEFDPTLANDKSQTEDVRSFPPNPWGLYEMHGNVDEWCQDWFADYPHGPVIDPVGPATGERRVLRGGGWIHQARGLRSAFRGRGRGRGDPGYRNRYNGFRLARGPEPGQGDSAGV